MVNSKIKEVLDILDIFAKYHNEITELDLRRVLSEHLSSLSDFHQTHIIDMMPNWAAPQSQTYFRSFDIQKCKRELSKL